MHAKGCAWVEGCVRVEGCERAEGVCTCGHVEGCVHAKGCEHVEGMCACRGVWKPSRKGTNKVTLGPLIEDYLQTKFSVLTILLCEHYF